MQRLYGGDGGPGGGKKRVSFTTSTGKRVSFGARS
jgi:hypothetical protein